MEYNFSQGDKLLVELITGEIFKGIYTSGGKDRVDLTDCVLDNQTDNAEDISHGKLSFYRADIRKIILIDRHELIINKSNEDNDETKIIKITECEYRRLNSLSHNYVYMATIDHRFNIAIDDLTNCENVAVTCLSTKTGRSEKPDLLVLCSWYQVYLFDLKIYNKKVLDKGLIEVFENPNIKKVVHDSRSFVDCMFHCFDVRVRNIFDTFVADHRISNKSRSLSECLSYYLNFPENIINKNYNFIKWDERPLEESSKIIASRLGCYLIALKNFLETEMLQEFYEEVENHSTSTLYKSPLEATTAMLKLQIS